LERESLNPKAEAIAELVRLVATLRGENGCPWDRQQTARSMRVYLLEEVYELLDALDTGMPAGVREELGDVLFHIFFLSRLYEEQALFDIWDVAASITEKMVHRHPHVFGRAQVEDAEAVRRRWHALKREEAGSSGKGHVAESVPASLPSLLRAYRLYERAARGGFYRGDRVGVLEKAEEKWGDLKSAMEGEDPEALAGQMGEFLLAFVRLCLQVKVHPEAALRSSLAKFQERFRHVEEALVRAGKDPEETDPRELEALWEIAGQAVGL